MNELITLGGVVNVVTNFKIHQNNIFIQYKEKQYDVTLSLIFIYVYINISCILISALTFVTIRSS